MHFTSPPVGLGQQVEKTFLFLSLLFIKVTNSLCVFDCLLVLLKTRPPLSSPGVSTTTIGQRLIKYKAFLSFVHNVVVPACLLTGRSALLSHRKKKKLSIQF